jgi:hypothetical protein
MLEPVHPEAVLPDRALCLPTFSHHLIVNKLLSLSLQTSVCPSKSPSRSLEAARPVGRDLRPWAKVSGSQTDLLTPSHDGRAEIIPFRYMPVLLGGKGISHVGWDTGDLPSQGEKYGYRNPRPRCPHVVAPV